MENKKTFVTYGTSKEEARHQLNTDLNIIKATRRFYKASEFTAKHDKDSRARVSDYQAARCLLETGETYESLMNMYSLGFEYGYKAAAKKYKAKLKKLKEGGNDRTITKQSGTGTPGQPDQ